jgi:hypothetical protein
VDQSGICLCCYIYFLPEHQSIVCLPINLMSIFITTLSPVCAPIGHLSVPKVRDLFVPQSVIYLCRNLFAVSASMCHLSVPKSVGCPCVNLSSICAGICGLSVHLQYKSPVFLCSMYVCMCLPSCFLLAFTVYHSPSMTAGRTAASRIRTRMIVVHSFR